MTIENQQVTARPLLTALYRDGYYPDASVDRCREILLRLCERIETERPADLPALYVLTHAATEEINDVEDADFEIETVAREEIAEEFSFIAQAYGFADVDVEELIAPRDW